MSYHLLTDGLPEDARKDLDYLLDREPGRPTTRQKGAGNLAAMMGGAGPKKRELPRKGGRR